MALTYLWARSGIRQTTIRGSVKVVTPPASEPVSVAEAEAFAQVTPSTANDALITTLISAVRLAAEAFTRRAFITQTVDVVLDDIDPDPQAGRMISDLGYFSGTIPSLLELPGGQLQSITGAYVTDDANVETTVDPTTYFADLVSEPGRIILTPGNNWPSHRTFAGFRVRFVAGWTSAGAVPADIALAIKRGVRYQWERRGDLVSEKLGDASMTYAPASASMSLPDSALALLRNYRILRLS